MTPIEADKIIAEFMGFDYCQCKPYSKPAFKDECRKCGKYFSHKHAMFRYSRSLDALVPVWEKLDLPRILEMDISGKGEPLFSFRYFTQLGYSHSAQAKTIQQAAAIATAKAIRELSSE